MDQYCGIQDGSIGCRPRSRSRNGQIEDNQWPRNEYILATSCEADRGLLKTWHNSQASKEKGSGTVTEAEANKLSVFRDGKWKGYNTVYEGPFYDAGLNSKGFLIIFPKDESGARVGKHLTAGLYCYYTQKNIGRHTRRDVISFETSPQPVVSSTPLELRLQGKFADDVAFDVEFECEDDKVSVEGGIKDPPGIKFPSRYNSRINVPAIYTPWPRRQS